MNGMNKLTECVSGRMRDLPNVNGELWNPIALDQEGFRFQFQNQSERSKNKWTSYVCVSKRGAVACTCSCPSHKTEYRMWKLTPRDT